MSELVVASNARTLDGSPLVCVTPETAGWHHVGFEVRRLAVGGSHRWEADAHERCVVVLRGAIDVAAGATFRDVGGRTSPFDGLPSAVYAPAGTAGEVVATRAGTEVAICSAPGAPGFEPYAIRPPEIEVELRGAGAMQRRVHPIVMGDRPAQSLLVVEVLTPAGHWSSYPPHKHDVDDPPRETALEETYYHRIAPATGFGLQRVYSAEGDLDETISFRDGDVVLVPRGYHAVAMPPGYDGYYLNVMAGPVRDWRMTDDPAHAWLRTW